MKTARPSLDAARCDLLEQSGEVDPLLHIAQEHRETLGSADVLFPGKDLAWVRAGRIARSDRTEYAKLVVRQLRCNKVCLKADVRSSTSVFAVGKSSGGLREV